MKLLVKVYSEEDELYELDLSENNGAAVSLPEGARIAVGSLHFDVHAHYVEDSSAFSLEIGNPDYGVLLRFGGVVSTPISLAASVPSQSGHIEAVFPA